MDDSVAKKARKRIEDVEDDDLLAVLLNQVTVGREARAVWVLAECCIQGARHFHHRCRAQTRIRYAPFRNSPC